MINNKKKNIQLSLNLKKKKIYEKDDFLVSNSNKEAYRLINSWPEWRSRKIIIFGDSGTGKPHLSKIWQNKASAIILNLNNAVSDRFNAPKLLVGTGKKDTHLCVVITADRGLCGGFNTNICKKAKNNFSNNTGRS